MAGLDISKLESDTRCRAVPFPFAGARGQRFGGPGHRRDTRAPTTQERTRSDQEHFMQPHVLSRHFKLAMCLALAPFAACTAPAPDGVQARAAATSDLPTHVPGDYEWDGDSDLVFQQDRTAFL